MRILLRRLFLAAFFILLHTGFAVAQPTLHLKTRKLATSASNPVTTVDVPRLFGHLHLLLQFYDPPSASTVAELKTRGVAVLADVPENGLLASVEGRADLGGLGLRFAGPVEPADKVSPLITAGDPAARNGYFLVEFYPDVNIGSARSLLLNSGIELHENPDVGPDELMIVAAPGSGVAAKLAQLDDVEYIFPAMPELVNGTPVVACVGALTTNGTTSQLIPTYGDGWDGPGLGAATLSYVFSHITSQLPAAAVEAEIERAMAEWSKVVQVNWNPGTDPNGAKTVNILFATYAHGDGYPFDGPGGVLAHTFYPAPPNPEPIAGDMHLDDSESWHIGSDTDVFSVVLHELGHALGLGHSDDPTAVMYPYYRMVSTLGAADIATISTMYAAQTSAPPPTPPVVTPPVLNPPTNTPPSNPPTIKPPANPAPPLTLTVTPPPAATAAATLKLSGTVSGGAGAIAVAWTGPSSSGLAQISGPAWTASAIPLAVGVNTITVTATAGASHASQSVTVTRQSTSSLPNPPSPTPTGDTTPPQLTITSSSSSVISTSAASIAVSGIASDNVGVTAITWQTNTGGSGTATGTTKWTAQIPLLVGCNTVTIRAQDAAGNTAWRSIIVDRQ